jgi:poly(3-hydroxybutyrate) depolymerase
LVFAAVQYNCFNTHYEDFVMLYNIYEMMHASLAPVKFSAIATRVALQHPYNPLSYTRGGRTVAAMAELVERATKRFGKPEFGLDTTIIDGKTVEVVEETIEEKPFCNLIHFRRKVRNRKDPKVLVVAPLSGHYATLLRGTVEALIPHHEVYITDWMDARQVSISEGKFDLDDCIDYLIDFMHDLGEDCHVMAVCQPAVPVLAAVSVMAARGDKIQPASMTLMGGPIDPRVSKTQVTQLAEERPLSWFENSVITSVPAYYPGAMRKVYPGFIQLSGFMSMNLDRHIGSHFDFYEHLVTGDGDSAEKHRVFYDEYLAVMDLTAEFYLQTVEAVFQKHSLPQESMIFTCPKTGEEIVVRPSLIKKTALLTVEGELDDISALGQTEAAHKLCSALPTRKKYHHMQKNVGHYGIFNGRRWREFIMPRVRHFIRDMDPNKKGLSAVPAKDQGESKGLTASLWKGDTAPKTSKTKNAQKSKTKKTATKKAAAKTKEAKQPVKKASKKDASAKAPKKSAKKSAASKPAKKKPSHLKIVSSSK